VFNLIPNPTSLFFAKACNYDLANQTAVKLLWREIIEPVTIHPIFAHPAIDGIRLAGGTYSWNDAYEDIIKSFIFACA